MNQRTASLSADDIRWGNRSPVDDLANSDAWTDAAVGERFAADQADTLRYAHRSKTWLVFSQHRYQPDRDGAVKRRLLEFVRRSQQRMLDIHDVKMRKRALDLAMLFEQQPRLERVLSLAASIRPLADTGDNWNADGRAFCVPNGIIDLRTGTLRAGVPEDRITMSGAVEFHPEASAGRWESFISEIMGGDAGLVTFLHCAIGYSLTGLTNEQCAFIGHGAGSNGKTTLYEAVSDLLGDYACNAPFSTFESKDRESISADVARLEGKRFVRASETNDGKRLNEARIKALTGGDMMTARFLHRNHVEFRPTLKLWLGVNHKPVVRDDGHGFWRRVRLIPFLQTFPVNDTLRRELDAEREGILAWCVRGAVAWQRHGLTAPPAVTAATAEYREESDPLADFLEEACAVEPGAMAKAGEVQALYVKWSERQGIPKTERLTGRALSQRLGSRFNRRHLNYGWVYDGFKVVTNRLW